MGGVGVKKISKSCDVIYGRPLAIEVHLKHLKFNSIWPLKREMTFTYLFTENPIFVMQFKKSTVNSPAQKLWRFEEPSIDHLIL